MNEYEKISKDNLLQELKLSLLIDKKHHAKILKKSQRKGLSVCEYLALIMEKKK